MSIENDDNRQIDNDDDSLDELNSFDDDFNDDDLDEDVLGADVLDEDSLEVSHSVFCNDTSIQLSESSFQFKETVKHSETTNNNFLILKLQDIINKNVNLLKKNLHHFFQQTIENFQEFKHSKISIQKLENILALCEAYYPINANAESNQFIDDRINAFQREIDQLKQAVSKSSSPMTMINEFIEKKVFPFTQNTFNEISLFHNELPIENQKTEEELNTIRDNILLLAEIEEIPIEEGQTTFSENSHYILEHRIDPNYGEGIILQNLLRGYRMKKSHKTLKKVGVALNYRFD